MKELIYAINTENIGAFHGIGGSLTLFEHMKFLWTGLFATISYPWIVHNWNKLKFVLHT